MYTIGGAPTKEKALSAYEHFLHSWLEKQTEAAECPGVGKEEFVCFPYSLVEPTYATVPPRTMKTRV